MEDKLPAIYGSIGNRPDICIPVNPQESAKKAFLDKCILVPIHVLTNPIDGYIVKMNRFWFVHNDCVLFYGGEIPQCHRNLSILDTMNDYGFEIRQIPLAYIKQID